MGGRRLTLTCCGWRFAPRLLPTLAVAALLPLLLGLGVWQLERAAYKRALVEAHAQRSADRPVNSLPLVVEAAAWRYRRAEFAGHLDTGRALLLDNRTHRGMAGYHLLLPLRLDDGRTLLVNLGWAPLGLDRDHLPPVPTRDGPLVVRGLLDLPPAAGLQLGPEGPEAQGWPRVLQRLDLAALADALGHPLLPLVLLEQESGDPGLVRDWRPATIGPARHTAYAVQWFALALALLVIYLAVNTRRWQRDD